MVSPSPLPTNLVVNEPSSQDSEGLIGAIVGVLGVALTLLTLLIACLQLRKHEAVPDHHPTGP
ncbi:hypothetical protein Tdes44962_MAKER08435 [Teratosphaeria destructans]|uniref:Uncharacterized protein n=1 Tax=Teratosphaeria destructans TaxID=418781 RepID=A0A9W7W4N0_9PEZI|nr:hypothetical protein Tdes44962_MAKER08435 [Teratosphaeria destructans]